MAWEFGSSAVSSATAPCPHPPSEASPLASASPAPGLPAPPPHPQRHLCSHQPQLCLQPDLILGLQTRKGPGAGCHLQSSWHLVSLPCPLPTRPPLPSPPSPHSPPVSKHRLWLLAVASVPLPAPLIGMVTPTSRPPVSGLLQRPPPHSPPLSGAPSFCKSFSLPGRCPCPGLQVCPWLPQS